MTPVIMDCTELLRNPIRTGIQRVVRELIRHWPADGPPLHVARFQPGRPARLCPVPASVIDLLTDRDPQALSLSSEQLAALIDHRQGLSEGVALPEKSIIFVPELFYDEQRSVFYQGLAKSGHKDLAILCFDFLPFLAPNLFSLKTAAHLMHYIMAVRSFTHVAHISADTRHDFETRIMRGSAPAGGIVLPLGADGIGVERQSWRADRRGFLVVGSIDGRKNQRLITEAFTTLRSRGHEIDLTIIGRAFENQDLAWLREAERVPGFRWIPNAADSTIAEAYRQVRATIYVSGAEGYGLPPVESLSVGVPVIAPAAMPSLKGLPPLGQIRIDPVGVDTIAEAMLEIMKPGVAERLWTEAARLQLANWRDFGQAAAAWLGERCQPRAA